MKTLIIGVLMCLAPASNIQDLPDEPLSLNNVNIMRYFTEAHYELNESVEHLKDLLFGSKTFGQTLIMGLDRPGQNLTEANVKYWAFPTPAHLDKLEQVLWKEAANNREASSLTEEEGLALRAAFRDVFIDIDRLYSLYDEYKPKPEEEKEEAQ